LEKSSADFKALVLLLGLNGATQLNYRKLKPEEKVNLAINMTDVCVKICAEGIKNKNPNITEKQLEKKLREIILLQKRRHHEV